MGATGRVTAAWGDVIRKAAAPNAITAAAAIIANFFVFMTMLCDILPNGYVLDSKIMRKTVLFVLLVPVLALAQSNKGLEQAWSLDGAWSGGIAADENAGVLYAGVTSIRADGRRDLGSVMPFMGAGPWVRGRHYLQIMRADDFRPLSSWTPLNDVASPEDVLRPCSFIADGQFLLLRDAHKPTGVAVIDLRPFTPALIKQ
jgi:hypothetical protein